MDLVLVFRLGEELYALEVAHVQELVESPSLHYIPRAPAAFLGAINFHGNILPVLDLASHLGLAAGRREGRIVVLSMALCSLALAVTAIQRIVPLDADVVLPFQEEGGSGSCVRATFERDGGMVRLLDVGLLLAGLEKI